MTDDDDDAMWLGQSVICQMAEMAFSKDSGARESRRIREFGSRGNLVIVDAWFFPYANYYCLFSAIIFVSRVPSLIMTFIFKILGFLSSTRNWAHVKKKGEVWIAKSQ